MEPKIKLENLSKVYQMYNRRSDKLAEIFNPKRKRNNKLFYALDNISFEVNKGETIGIIGTNGSGKSTLSNLLAGVIPPTSGEMEINGEVSLIAINAGLKKELTGMENIQLKCLMLGLTMDDIKEITPKIIEFAEIGNFVQQPVKNYSSGMKSRLGFAISVHTDPDILIIDEALSVGDKTFYKKSLDKIAEFKADGKTIFFISHSNKQVGAISDRVLWLNAGKVKEFGETKEVIKHYNEYVKWFNQLSKTERKQHKQEMVDRQTFKQGDGVLRENRKRHKKRNIKFFLQISAIFLVTITSALFMFIGKSPLAFYHDWRTDRTIKTVEANTDLAIEQIKDSGMIISRTANLFSTTEMKQKITTIPFATPIFVLEQIDDAYKVEYDGQEAYIKARHVSLDDFNPVTADQTVLDLRSVLPSSLASSFEFFLIYLGSDYETTLTELDRLTSEVVENGLQILEYDYYNLAYLFNEEQISVEMIVKNIDVNHSLIEQLRSQASLISEDEDVFYTALADYDLVIDVENRLMKIIIRE